MPHTDKASQAQPCRTNSIVHGPPGCSPRSWQKGDQTSPAGPPLATARCPRMPTPGPGRAAPHPVSAASPRHWTNPLPRDFSSRAPDVGTPLSNPKLGLAGAVRRARTTHGWQTVGQFSLPQPRRTGETIGLLPACVSWVPKGHPAARRCQ